MFLLIALSLFSSEVLGTFERDVETGEIEPAWKFRRTFRDVGTLSQHEKDVEEEKNADNSNVGHFKPDPYPGPLEDGVTLPIKLQPLKLSAYEKAFNDPAWKKQWHLQDYRKTDGPVMDLNVVPVFQKMGYTGEGITVAVVDGGVDMKHPDLIKNLDKELQYSVSDGSKNGNPYKYGWQSSVSGHGTQMAGIIGMEADNGFCGVGMAHKAKIVAINAFKLMDTGHYKAKALVHALHKVDIYSCSWGPSDSGSEMEPINEQLAASIDRGIKEGRGGKGAIYTFPSGNGRTSGEDNCSSDDLVNYLYTIAIAGASQFGKRSSFSEACTAVFATTYSGDYGDRVLTTSISGTAWACFEYCTGTSAATPQASAIIALALQANPKLTYRDVMHLITMSSEVAPLADNESWNMNGAGFWVSVEFGFGLMNAYNMVTLAKDWVNVPPKAEPCEFKFNVPRNLQFKQNKPAQVVQRFDVCQVMTVPDKRVKYLEQVILVSSIKHRYRGALSITLTSPRGTKSEIISPRKKDTSHKGLSKWRSKSLHNWGEDPTGYWTIDVSALYVRDGLSAAWENMYQTFVKPLTFRMPDYEETGEVKSFTIWFHGTTEAPDHYQRRLVPRTYAAFRTKDQKASDPLTVKQKIDGGLRTHTMHPSQTE